MANRWITTVFKGVRKFINGATGQDLVERSDVEIRGATVYDDPLNARTIIEIPGDLATATPDAVPNTLAKRNASANCSFALVQCSSLNSTGNVTVSGNASATGTVTGQQIISTSGTVTTPAASLSLAASGGSAALSLSGTNSAATLSANLTANSFRVAGATTYTQQIDPIGLTRTTTIDWEYQGVGNNLWVTRTTSGLPLHFPISHLLPHGARLDGASIFISVPAHANLPQAKPHLDLSYFAQATKNNIVSSLDASATAGAYNIPHDITISGQTHIVDKANSYFIEFYPEAGTNSIAGLLVGWVTLTFTVPAGTPIRPF